MQDQQATCQSCAMPMTEDKHFGTEADGTPSREYCTYCYQNGSFTNPNATLDGMVDFLSASWGEWTQRPDLSAEEAKPEVFSILTNLKRWKK